MEELLNKLIKVTDELQGNAELLEDSDELLFWFSQEVKDRVFEILNELKKGE